jgi:serine/threonine protein phosphatase PrpC
VVRLLQRPDLGLFALAHGLGGSAAAADLTLDALGRSIEAARAAMPPELTSDSSSTMLAAVIQEANDAWTARLETDPSLSGVGSTLVAVLRTGHGITVAHLGDCAALLLRQGAVMHRTLNHTLAREHRESAGRDPGGGDLDRIIVRAVGMGCDAEIQAWEAAAGDIVLLSTGVHDILSPLEMSRLYRASPREFVEGLVREARSRPFQDDIAALAFSVC